MTQVGRVTADRSVQIRTIRRICGTQSSARRPFAMLTVNFLPGGTDFIVRMSRRFALPEDVQELSS